ncbi:MAG: hypothetical protein ACREBT_05625 [Thermoplasmata archaeon]
MSAIFQRPLCEMGKAYDYAFRPIVGEPNVGSGGPCDERPTRSELCSAEADPSSPSVNYHAFLLCPEHRTQLRTYDARIVATGRKTRFRP